MSEQSKPWRWVQGDDNDPAERWILVEGDGPLPGPRVVLECGQVDAADQDAILAARELIGACERLLAVCRGLGFTPGDEPGFKNRAYDDGISLVARAKGGSS